MLYLRDNTNTMKRIWRKCTNGGTRVLVLELAGVGRPHKGHIRFARQLQRFARLAHRILGAARVVAEIGGLHIMDDQRVPGGMILRIVPIGSLQLHRLFEPVDLCVCARMREMRQIGAALEWCI